MVIRRILWWVILELVNKYFFKQNNCLEVQWTHDFVQWTVVKKYVGICLPTTYDSFLHLCGCMCNVHWWLYEKRIKQKKQQQHNNRQNMCKKKKLSWNKYSLLFIISLEHDSLPFNKKCAQLKSTSASILLLRTCMYACNGLFHEKYFVFMQFASLIDIIFLLNKYESFFIAKCIFMDKWMEWKETIAEKDDNRVRKRAKIVSMRLSNMQIMDCKWFVFLVKYCTVLGENNNWKVNAKSSCTSQPGPIVPSTCMVHSYFAWNRQSCIYFFIVHIWI